MNNRISDTEFRAMVDSVTAIDGQWVLAQYGIEPARNNSTMFHCPFHEDRTPSFNWNGRINRFKCFGASCPTASESMDNISLVQRLKNMNFMDALRELGAPTRDGIRAPAPAFRPRAELVDLTIKDRHILEWVATRYHDLLMGRIWPKSPVAGIAREYMKSRGITPETAERLGLGVSDGRALLSLRCEHADMEAALLRLRIFNRARVSGRVFERFSGFITTPNRIVKDDVDFIYGRNIDPDARFKFMGPSDYRKPVFGLARALNETEGGLRALHLAEGLFDGLTLMQWEIPGAVALCGNVNQHQIKQLEGFRVYAALDNDDGGRALVKRLRETLGEDAVADVRLPEEFKDIGDLAARPDGSDIYERAARAAQEEMGWHREGGNASDDADSRAAARPEDS